MILIGDNSDLLFYLHMTKNGHKILMLAKPTKATLGVRRKFIWTILEEWLLIY